MDYLKILVCEYLRNVCVYIYNIMVIVAYMYVILISQHKHFHDNYKTQQSKNVFNIFLDIINIGFDTTFESLAPQICKI